jgi:hypothetical protein
MDFDYERHESAYSQLHLKQDEKSDETPRRQLEAAILCVIERGYANTTGSEIAERAGYRINGRLYQARLELAIPSRSDAYLPNSIRAVYIGLSEFGEKTLSGLFEPFTSRVPNPSFP